MIASAFCQAYYAVVQSALSADVYGYWLMLKQRIDKRRNGRTGSKND
jgi:hypothetical protein